MAVGLRLFTREGRSVSLERMEALCFHLLALPVQRQLRKQDVPVQRLYVAMSAFHFTLFGSIRCFRCRGGFWMADCGFLAVCNNDLFVFLLSLSPEIANYHCGSSCVAGHFSIGYRTCRWAEVRARRRPC